MKKNFAVAAIAAGAIGALAFGSAISADAAYTAYYAAGTRQSDKPSETSATEWTHFMALSPQAYTVQYPRDLAPLVGTTTLDRSVAEGRDNALELIYAHGGGGNVTLAGVSQGAVLMFRTKQALIAGGYDPEKITVSTFGDPVNPDGGLLSKLDRYNIRIPGFTPATHTPGEGAYVTFAIEYDIIADAPDNLNPVSWANAVMGGVYDHATYSLDLVNEAGADNRIVSNADEWYESQGDTQNVAYYQHNLIKQTNLPLTRPLRQIGTDIADDNGDIVVNRAVDQLDNLLRPIVDAGYDGGQPGGTRHVGTTTKHYLDADSTLAGPSPTAKKVSRTPVRDAIKNISAAVKKLTNSLARKPTDAS